MRDLPDRAEIERRLRQIFPREAFDTTLSNPLAAAAVAAMLYVDAVQPDDAPDSEDGLRWVRPTTVLWMNDDVYARPGVEERTAWRRAALGGNARRAVEELLGVWGIARDLRWYADNTRETLRDETWPSWRRHGAVVLRAGIKTTSDKPRWALAQSFAGLFNPRLLDDALDDAITAWVEEHMNPGDRLRRATMFDRAQHQHEVEVTLPDGTIRRLEPGEASLVLKGVSEEWAPLRLIDPVVVSLSEPGAKVYVLDAAQLTQLGVTIDPTTLLPDAVVADIGVRPVRFWIIEVAASDGVIHEARREDLLAWADAQRIPRDQCAFMTAFVDRNSVPAKRRLKDLAVGSFAWFLAEPTRELEWREIHVPGGTVSRFRP